MPDNDQTPRMTSIREEAHRLIDQLPDDATWDDVIYQVYVRQSIEAGLADVREGRTISIEEVKRRMGV
jgi:predicted transcriptional regulator